MSSSYCFAVVRVVTVFSRLCVLFSVFFYSFVLLCWSSSVWPHQDCVCNCFLLNEKYAQARSRKKNIKVSVYGRCVELIDLVLCKTALEDLIGGLV